MPMLMRTECMSELLKEKCTFESQASIQGRQGRKQMWFPVAATSGLWASIINRLWSLTPTHILALPHTNTSLLIFTWVLRMKRKCFGIEKGSFGLSGPTRLLIHTFANLSLFFIQRIAISILSFPVFLSVHPSFPFTANFPPFPCPWYSHKHYWQSIQDLVWRILWLTSRRWADFRIANDERIFGQLPIYQPWKHKLYQ